MGINIKTLAASKKYTKETATGGGAIQGLPGKNGKDAPAIISVNVDENNILTVTLSDGTTLTGGTIKTISGIDGRSIVSITKNNSDNIIVTFSDGTIQNLGKLSDDISGDFLTENGFGNIRYYNGKFQVYKNGAWVDVVPTPDNTIIVNMMPNPMQRIIGIYDHEVGKNKLKWLEPEDTVVDGQVICVVDKVVIRRKLGSAPAGENDGDLVLIVDRKDFGSHDKEWYFDEGVAPALGDIYYYKAFPVSTTNFANGASVNNVEITAKNYYLFGYTIDQNESNPDSMITYNEDCAGFNPVGMNYVSDVFSYGDWKDFWFIRDLKPCMLNYDGTVTYELNPGDYTKKKDGTTSDIANDDFQGNVMVGIPKIYWKIIDNGDRTANIYISDKKLDENFVCWSHIDNNGNEIDYCYMPAYNGSNVNSVLRSLSGRTPIHSQTVQTEINYAKANNLSNDIIWYTELFSDRMLINLMLLLIGKSTDSQNVFGNGHYTGGTNMSHLLQTGTMDKKGLFWGTNSTWSGVKVFGIENWWGNQWRRIAGWINDHGIQKIKMTYGKSDGSTVDGYNIDGNGYIEIPDSLPIGTTGGYISHMIFTENGIIPKKTSGSSTTYYTDGFWFDNNQVGYADTGGASSSNFSVGALCSTSDSNTSYTNWIVASTISCKPLSIGGE